MPEYTFEQFSAVRNYSDLSFSPDGQWVTYAVNTSGQFNVWKQPVHLANGRPQMPIQLTSLVERTARRAAWSPDGERIITMADQHGNEFFQIFEIPPEHGWLYPLTEKEKVRHELGGDPFSPDGRFIAYSCNARQPQDMDLTLHNLATGETATPMPPGSYYAAGSWSPDGRLLQVVRVNSNTDLDILLLEVGTGDSRLLTPHEGEVKYIPGPWRPDGSGFYLASDQDREFSALAFYHLEEDRLDWLETPDWDVTNGSVSKDGRFLAWLVNENGYTQLYVRDLDSGNLKTFPDLPRGVYTNPTFSPAEPILGLYINRSVGPSELYLLHVETGEFWTLSQAFLGGIPITELVEPELIRYETHDGRFIPAFLYQPRRLAKGERAPVILSIHGGPEAQELPTYNYNGLYQYLLHKGIGILATNVRGSTGYGKTYQKLIHRDWGGDELKDFDYAVRYLHTLDWVAPDRIGVFGGSFGGFATLSCITRLPHYWAAAVDIVGPSNLVTFVRAVPPAWKRFMAKWVGDPEEDYDFLMERSPISYVNNVEAPLLVIQGANDPRVVKGESDQMVEQLEKLGRPVKYLVFPDEGHGFTKTANWLKALGASADWFEKHL